MEWQSLAFLINLSPWTAVFLLSTVQGGTQLPRTAWFRLGFILYLGVSVVNVIADPRFLALKPIFGVLVAFVVSRHTGVRWPMTLASVASVVAVDMMTELLVVVPLLVRLGFDTSMQVLVSDPWLSAVANGAAAFANLGAGFLMLLLRWRWSGGRINREAQ